MNRRIFMTAGAAVGLFGASTAARAGAIWVAVSGPGNRYRLKMPLGYRYLHVPTHDGTLNSYVYMLPDKVTLEQAQGGMMRSWPGSTVQQQRQIETGSLTGREFVLAAAGGRFVRARLYLTPAAVYSQVAQGPMSELGNPLVTQFFDSLRFA